MIFSSLLETFYAELVEPDLEKLDCCPTEMMNVIKRDPAEFRQIASAWTQLYANEP